MKLKEVQQKIDNIDYWDMEVLELNITYFGDEVEMIVDNDDDKCWKISFISCSKVLYETDADRRNICCVRDMKHPQLGYYAQDISVRESLKKDFFKVDLDLAIMELHIECRKILVEEISRRSL